MRYITPVALIVLQLNSAGCAINPAVQLSWDDRDRSVYRMTREPYPQEMELNVDAMLSNPEVLQAKVAELKGLELDSRAFPLRLTLEGDGAGRIEVLVENAPVTYETEAVDDNERYLREMREKMVGAVQLNTAIDRYGENQKLYTKNQQYNLVAMLFRVPDRPVRVEESWRLPIVLTSLNTPFLADKIHRDNRVWVNDIVERDEVGRVAEVVYLLREEIEGHRRISINDQPEPFKFTSTYFAVGEFALDEHRWLRYAGLLVGDRGILRTVDLIALLPASGEDR